MIVITGPGRSGTSLIAAIYRELGVGPGGRWRNEVDAGLENPQVHGLNALMARDLRMSMHSPSRSHRWLLRYRRQPLMLNWRRFDRVVDAYGGEMRRIADTLEVVKDPRMMWMMPAWLAARASISHVLVTTRHLDAAVASRTKNDLTDFSPHHLRNALIYGMGMSLTALWDYGVSHAVIRFPDWLDEPDSLYEAGVWPPEVTRSGFTAVFEALVDRDQVHH